MYTLRGLLRGLQVYSNTFRNYSAMEKLSDIKQIFSDAVESVQPRKLIKQHLQITGSKLIVQGKEFVRKKNVYVIGFGKAVLEMASEVENILGECLVRGIVSVPLNSLKKDQKMNSVIEVFEGAENNLPDKSSETATDEMLMLVKNLDPEDLLLVLISGGGSALLTKPIPGVNLDEKVLVAKLLASVGADITELNSVRKKLSLVKGGKLGILTYPIPTIVLILSDIINDPVEFIASGPTVPNLNLTPTPIEVIRQYKLELKLPRHVLSAIREDEPGPDIPINRDSFPHVHSFVVGSNSLACSQAQKSAVSLNYDTILLSTSMNGLVHELALFYSRLVLEICNLHQGTDSTLVSLLRGCPYMLEPNILLKIQRTITGKKALKLCLVAGGETTVKVNGTGKGGRNQELSLWFSHFMNAFKQDHTSLLDKYDILFFSAGTDGIDGPTDAAGAFGSPELVQQAQSNKMDENSYLASNDSYNFYTKLDNGKYLLKIGHTGTNVMDINLLTICDNKIN